MVEASSRPASSDVVIHVEHRMLLQRHLRGDADAFAALVHSLGGAVWRTLGRCGVPATDRDDLFQEVFVKVHRHAATFQADRPLKPWVLAIALNTVRSFFSRRRVDADLASLPERASGEPSSQDLLEARESAGWIERRVAGLPPAQRDIVVMICLEGLAQKDVAAALGLPVNTVKTHLRRARLALAAELQRRSTAQAREAGR